MATPVVEPGSTIRSPFANNINDTLCDLAYFYGGHFVLVGDTLTTFRPHTTMATEQAVMHCNLMERVLCGEKSLEDWNREVTIFGKRHWLLSRVGVVFGQGARYSFLKAT
jgi:hypothetical protein